jgi:type II secretory pathway component GspD/PulD (secretin)
VIPDNRASLRMGGDVPIPSITYTPGQKEEGKPATPATSLQSYSYRSIGTNIDVVSVTAAEGQYRLTLTVEESSIYPPELSPANQAAGSPSSFRSFKSTNTIALRDGQSLDYTMATDRVSGEVNRVSVKMTVVK